MAYSTYLDNINTKNISVVNPQIIYSLYVPLGENAIIQLVDSFKKRNLDIIHTDLYYIVKIKYDEYIISFYSRGLIMFSKDLAATDLFTAVSHKDDDYSNIYRIIKKLLSKYQLNLISLFNNIQEIPVHITIAVQSFSGQGFTYLSSLGDMNAEEMDYYRDKLLVNISKSESVQALLKNPRSVDSRPHEDIIIGTHGSIIRSNQVDLLISYHAYNRALHLFLKKYNERVEEVWQELNEYTAHLLKLAKTLRTGDEGLFSTELHDQVTEIKSSILAGVANIDNFLVLTKFINGSIDFTLERYLTIREKEGAIAENSFHIRKTLRVLQDRAENLAILSESLISRANSLVSRIDLYDTGILYKKEQKVQYIALFASILGIGLAVIALFL